MISNINYWRLSLISSLILTIILICLWSEMHKYKIPEFQLENETMVNEYLEKNWLKTPDAMWVNQQTPIVKIKTGILVQSLEFFNSSDVEVTGYIWQHYEDGIHDKVKPKKGEAGFILPEQVNSGGDIQPREAYRIREGNKEIIGWYFEATLRQSFKYTNYPFDHKTVWIRIWDKNFSDSVILVPDLDAYKSTGKKDIFGIDKNIVLKELKRENTYFDYQHYSYDTNFGSNNCPLTDPNIKISHIENHRPTLHSFPELHYNIVVKRQFGTAFIAYILPLFVVACLLFVTVLTVGNSAEKNNAFGFNLSGFIGIISALFFVVMLTHIQIRQQFTGSDIIYIEYFYILGYVYLALSTANAYLFASDTSWSRKFIMYEDNLMPKVLYWPVLIGSLVLMTLIFV